MDIARIVRDSGIAETIKPIEELKQQEAVRLVVDGSGAILPTAAQPFRAPQTLHWYGTSGQQRVARAGFASVVAAHCGTAPSTGSGAVITVTQTTDAGSTTLGFLKIPVGQVMADTELQVPVNAGAWINAVVTTAAGAANVSIALVIKEG